MRIVTLVVGAAVVAAMVSVSAQGKSQWDGVFTTAQADRGSTLYVEKCSSCHGTELQGGEMAPALVGGEFAANWNDLSVGDLFERMRISMPQNDPGSISRPDNAAILAFILRRGNYPAGATELPSELSALRAIKFLARNPKGAN